MARAIAIGILALSAAMALTCQAGAAGTGRPHAGSTIVQAALGGQILGYDLDQNGTRGLMSEYVAEQNAQDKIAIETFDQDTGKVRIIRKIDRTYGDFVTLGVVGTSIGLVDYQKEHKLLHRLPDVFELLNPLDGNRINGTLSLPLKKREYISEASESQGSAVTALLGFKSVVHPYFQSFVIAANAASNTASPKVQLKNRAFAYINSPVIAQNTATNVAVVASSSGSPELAIVDLTKLTVSEFSGLGEGRVNGIAVDSTDNIACTTTADDNLEFYDLATGTGTEQTIQGATSDYQAGADVQFDAVNNLFLILQPDCSEGSGSCIEVYDTKGTWVEAVAGLTLAQGLVTPEHIAFNPTTRTGFLQSAASDLASFAY